MLAAKATSSCAGWDRSVAYVAMAGGRNMRSCRPRQWPHYLITCQLTNPHRMNGEARFRAVLTMRDIRKSME